MFKLDSKQQKLLENIAKKYSLELVLLFGSRAKGKERTDSDYDIAYLSKAKLNAKDEGGIIIELMPVLKTTDAKLIDLTDIRDADPLLLYYIARDGQQLYGEKVVYHQFRVHAFNQYIDTEPLRDLEKLMISKRQEVLMNKYGK